MMNIELSNLEESRVDNGPSIRTFGQLEAAQKEPNNYVCQFFINCFRQVFKRWLSTLAKNRSFLLKIVGLCCYMAYFFYAVARCLKGESCSPGQDNKEFWSLVGITCFGLTVALINAIRAFLKRQQYSLPTLIMANRQDNDFALPLRQHLINISKLASPKIIWFGLPSICLLYVVVDSLAFRGDPYALMSLIGVAAILTTCFVLSKERQHVLARPVVAGLGMQFVFALIVLRWDVGQIVFQWLGDKVALFLRQADAGALFVWPTAFKTHDFVFFVMPLIPFFSAVISVLYCLGWIQAVIRVLAGVMERLLGTTAGESTTCSANVFLGLTEAPLLIRPFLPHMTNSELHAVMTGGFATIAGGVMGAFIALGVDPRHLLAASLMSAPASLAISKLVFPEKEKTELKVSDIQRIDDAGKDSKPGNVIEAACEGACVAVEVVAGVVANLIAFRSLLSLVNNLLAWLGERVGLAPPFLDDFLSLEFIASYAFYPIAFAIGIPYQHCRAVAKLLGLKMFVNEFLAFGSLSEMIQSRKEYDNYYCKHAFISNNSSSFPVKLANGSYLLPAISQTIGPFIDERSESIATYALCGFSNIASIGIQIGGLGALAPSKKSDCSDMALRAMLSGTAVNLLNAAIAGLLIGTTTTTTSQTSWNVTCSTAVVH